MSTRKQTPRALIPGVNDAQTNADDGPPPPTGEDSFLASIVVVDVFRQ